MAEEALRQAADAIIREAVSEKHQIFIFQKGCRFGIVSTDVCFRRRHRCRRRRFAVCCMAIMPKRHAEKFEKGFDADFSFQTSDGHRQRVNVFRQQKKMAGTIRLLNASIPTLEELKMPTVLYEMAKAPRGLILVTGPTGSGKQPHWRR